jgi:hypothetical protein
MLRTGREFGYVNWEASRRHLAALLTPRSHAPNLGGFGTTIRRHLFLCVAIRCKIGVSKPFSLLSVARRFSVLRPEWCQKWCQIASVAPLIVQRGCAVIHIP